MSKKSALALLAAGIGGAAIAGVGLSMGRDLYKSTKKKSGSILVILGIAGAIALPLLGARGLIRGHDRGLFGTLFLTIIGNIMLIALGFLLAVVILLILGLLGGGNQDALVGALLVAFCSTILFSLIGFIWGATQRPRRMRTFATAKMNERFLESIGFRETGGDKITHYDANGQALRFLESHGNQLVFMAVGRRGKRAFIDIAPDGKMLAYSGVV